ncbi:TPA: hypothetical protein HA251_06915 [Candidatus Woesearchaeota archaeon]|nr:hypothetical protein [Candidatus Woesearchaeota archaeon]
MHIAFIGGAKGVGKTTVVDALRSRRPEWGYAYNGAFIRERLGTMPFQDIKERMIDEMLVRDVPLLIVDTHYAQQHRGIWQACWTDEDVGRIAASPCIEAVQTYVISAIPDAVYARRASDTSRHRRVEMADVVTDMLANDTYFQRMNRIFTACKVLERTGRVQNDDVASAAESIERLISQY